MEDIDIELLRNKKKKGKKLINAAQSVDVDIDIIPSDVAPAAPREGENYTYIYLLTRFYRLLQDNNPNHGTNKVMKLPIITLSQVGSKKTAWHNFGKMCAALNRPKDHVMKFILAELAASGSLDSTNRLILRGKFFANHIQPLIQKYSIKYVVCQTCKSPNTIIIHDSATRLDFLSCSKCFSKKSIVNITRGYHAILKGERAA